MVLTKKISLLAGMICGLVFAPVFFSPGIFALSLLLYQIHNSSSVKMAAKYGYCFGVGFYLTSLYWIAFGPAVFIEEFWWVIPFALFGLPVFLAMFIALVACAAYRFRYSNHLNIAFCSIWVIYEWLISWVLTGLPWSLIGYGFCFSDALIQFTSIVGILGLSFSAAYVGSIFYTKKNIIIRLLISLLILSSMFFWGQNRLNNNPTLYGDVNIRLVQPSIKQTAKWDLENFWANLDKHVQLSKSPAQDGIVPDVIIWSEAALTAPYYHKEIREKLNSVFTKNNQVLLFGGISDNRSIDNYELYSSLLAISADNKVIFDYHKSHLVPFGEYIPLSKILPLKKITHGMIDYTSGKREVLNIDIFNIKVQPMICYESIFFDEVRIDSSSADLIVNITNDAWYGNSSGPYQHMHIARMRSVENGIPMVRVANNGISVVVDPVGRVINKLELNKIEAINTKIIKKLEFSTVFSNFGNIVVDLYIVVVLIIQLFILMFVINLKFFWDLRKKINKIR